MKNIRTVAFALTMTLYLWFPFSMIRQQERILEKGTPFRFEMQPVDPKDPFRGSYMALNFEAPFLPADTSLQEGQRVYVTLRTDDLGFTHFEKVLAAPPNDRPFVKTYLQYRTDEGTIVGIPVNMQRYYLNEKLAPQAEEAYFRLLGSTDSAEGSLPRVFAVVRIWEGEALIEEIYFDGKPLKEYLN